VTEFPFDSSILKVVFHCPNRAARLRWRSPGWNRRRSNKCSRTALEVERGLRVFVCVRLSLNGTFKHSGNAAASVSL
jgi:hypothetical protein